MKPFLFVLAFSIQLHVFSQRPQIGIDTSRWFQKIPNNPLNPVQLNLVQVYPQAKLSHTLPNGTRVYKLPSDNMPCLVPDTAMYNYNMPVARGNLIGTMPNLSPRSQIIPKKKNN